MVNRAIGWCVLGLLMVACGDDDDSATGDGRGADAAISADAGAGRGGTSGGSASGRGGASGSSASGRGGSGAMTATLDPCTLLTPAEWAPLMEAEPTVEMRMGSAGPVSLMRCDWTHEVETRRQWANISVSVAGAYGPSPMSMAIDNGDEGYALATDRARTIDIGWKKGSLSATFKYSALVLPAGKAWPELRDGAIELARLAASRMP
jgi:hypothetical protein